jgi:tRNA threonylcarbamoyladenosine biosynthesis protein TsaB
MSAKALAYATGCVLLGVETFAAVAQQAQVQAVRLDVLADAQQGKVYVQPFARPTPAADWQPTGPLAIVVFAEWLARREPDAWVSGPGLHTYRVRLPEDLPMAATEAWDPRPESLLHLGMRRYHAGDRDNPRLLEPLYLRPSAAEEQWQRRRDS